MAAETIVVDALSVHMGGGASFLTRQLQAVRDVAPERKLIVLSAPWNHDALLASMDRDATLQRVPVRGLLSRLAYEQLALPRRRDRDAVLYCPGNLVPLLPSRLPTVLALQNPNMVGRGPQEAHNRRWRRRLQVDLTRRSLRRADRVVAISEALRDEVADDGLVEKERLHVVPSGGPPAAPAAPSEPDGFPFGALDYFLVLANDAPHKRHDHVVRAWALAFDRADAPGLVFAGRMSETHRAAQRALVPPARRSQLLHLGPIEQTSQVAWLLRHARALVSAASLEAHPLTPAEAGTAGCPLILSDIAPHREVADPYATFVRLDDLDGLATALRIAAGREARVRWEWPVTWEENARRLLDVFDELVP